MMDRPSEGGSERAGERFAPSRFARRWSQQDFRAAPPEALAQPALVHLRHDQIDGDPYNVRERLPSVHRLAWSIYQYGLLENLLVIEQPDPARRAAGKPYQLAAGSRRFEAIRRLIEGVEAPPGSDDRERGVLWTWPAERTVPCLVLGTEGHYEHLIENIERSQPEPWEIGRRVSETLDAGVSSRELGTRLGRSNGWITRYAFIGRGLAPELIERLKKDRVELKLGELAALSAIKDQFGDPDGARQIAAYEERRARRRKRSKRIDPQSYRATIKRLQHLRSDMPMPAVLRPTVMAIVEYLEGAVAPKFRQLETELFERVKSLSPFLDEET